MAWWYGTSLLLLVGILGFAPNTDIESWARQEARARLDAAAGSAPPTLEFGTHRFNLVQENRDATWDKFSVRSVRMTEEDDDDEEEDEEEEEGEDEDEDNEDDE
jgi:phage portal protein BeeE